MEFNPYNEMKIVQIAPFDESVRPQLQGRTEKLVFTLTEELVSMGHEVTLFARAGSKTSARLVSVSSDLPGRGDPIQESNCPDLLALSEAFSQGAQHDLIHSHLDYLTLPFTREAAVPTLVTLHGPLDEPALPPLYSAYPRVPLVSISDAQRRCLSLPGWMGTVRHGLNLASYPYHAGPGSYLAFLGAISPENRPDWAIEVSKRCAIPLKIAGRVSPADRDYFQGTIRPGMAGGPVEYVGDLTDQERGGFLGGAIALFCPVDRPESFALTMIESMAYGTPVVARPCGSVPEIVREGITGLMGKGLEELVEAVKRVHPISRKECRRQTQERFSADVMARNYLKIYESCIHRFVAPGASPFTSWGPGQKISSNGAGSDTPSSH